MDFYGFFGFDLYMVKECTVEAKSPFVFGIYAGALKLEDYYPVFQFHYQIRKY